MRVTTTKIRKWGNSLGLTIPRKVVEEEGLEQGEEVEITIRKKQNVLERTFGTLEMDDLTEQEMKEVDRELYPEE